MRALPESNNADGEERDSDGALLRRRVLLRPEQRPEEPPAEIRFELLLCFVRHLVRNTVSYDALALAYYAAMNDCGVSEEEGKKFMKAVMEQRDNHSMWPKGF